MTARILTAVALLCTFAASAFAAPGYQVTQFAVKPMEAMNFQAALKAWTETASGKKYKGRIMLQQHVADGMNPATHTIIAAYPSLAESEKFSNMVTSDEAAMADWVAYITKASSISTLTFQGRYVHVAAWGDLSDKDVVWQNHSLTTDDAASTYRALDAWMKSDTGAKFPGQMHLIQTLAAGDTASHVISIGYASMAEMEAWGATAQGSAGLAQLLHTFSVINEYHGSTISTTQMAVGDSIKSVLK